MKLYSKYVYIYAYKHHIWIYLDTSFHFTQKYLFFGASQYHHQAKPVSHWCVLIGLLKFFATFWLLLHCSVAVKSQGGPFVGWKKKFFRDEQNMNIFPARSDKDSFFFVFFSGGGGGGGLSCWKFERNLGTLKDPPTGRYHFKWKKPRSQFLPLGTLNY